MLFCNCEKEMQTGRASVIKAVGGGRRVEKNSPTPQITMTEFSPSPYGVGTDLSASLSFFQIFWSSI
jgi:hypothetical protein